MTNLLLNGTEINSLAELQENYDSGQIKEAFVTGTLKKWLEDRYYIKEAAAVGALGKEMTTDVEQTLCRIIGVDYMRSGKLSAEQRAAYEKKVTIVRRYTDDEEILSHITETATNQTELAKLLNAGFTTIYLCSQRFTIPINKSGIHYIGVGDPKMDAPFTEEQYRRAGITFERIRLPETVDPAVEREAKFAAKSAGYDDFSDDHNALATVFHTAMKCDKATKWCYLDHNAMEVVTESYRNKYTAKNAARRVLDDAYDKANNILVPGNKACVASQIAKQYGAMLSKRITPLLCRLKDVCMANSKVEEQFAKIEKMVEDAGNQLMACFEEELNENSSFYMMYEKSYFLDKINITANDYNTDLFDSELANGLARLFFDETEYTADGLLEIMTELQDDMNSHAEMFYSAAYDEYRNYCRKIENIAGEIGDILSDDVLVKIGLLKKNCSA